MRWEAAVSVLVPLAVGLTLMVLGIVHASWRFYVLAPIQRVLGTTGLSALLIVSGGFFIGVAARIARGAR